MPLKMMKWFIRIFRSHTAKLNASLDDYLHVGFLILNSNDVFS